MHCSICDNPSWESATSGPECLDGALDYLAMRAPHWKSNVFKCDCIEVLNKCIKSLGSESEFCLGGVLAYSKMRACQWR